MQLLPNRYNGKKRLTMKKTLIGSLLLALALPVVAFADGAAIYKAKCAGCHGPDGGGSVPMGKALKVKDLRSDRVQRQTDLELTKVIAGGQGKMPAYGKKLTTAEIQSIIAFIRTLKN